MSGLTELNKQALKAAHQLGAKQSRLVKIMNKTNVYDPEHQRKASQASVLSQAGKSARSTTGKVIGKNKHRNILFTYQQRFTAYWRGKPMFCVSHLADASDFGRIVAKMDPIIEKKFKSKNFRFTDVINKANKILFWSCEKEGLGPEQPETSQESLSHGKYSQMIDLYKNAKTLKHKDQDLLTHFQLYQHLSETYSNSNEKKILAELNKKWKACNT